MTSVKKIIVTAIGVISGILTIIQFIWAVMDIQINKISIIIDLNYFIIKGINGVLLLITLAIFILCIGILYRMNKSNKKIQEELKRIVEKQTSEGNKERSRYLKQGGGFLMGDFGDCQMKGVKIVYFLMMQFGKIWCTEQESFMMEF